MNSHSRSNRYKIHIESYWQLNHDGNTTTHKSECGSRILSPLSTRGSAFGLPLLFLRFQMYASKFIRISVARHKFAWDRRRLLILLRVSVTRTQISWNTSKQYFSNSSTARKIFFRESPLIMKTKMCDDKKSETDWELQEILQRKYLMRV